MAELIAAITNGDYTTLHSKLNAHELDYDEQRQLIAHAEAIEQKSQKNALLSYTAKNGAIITGIAASLALAYLQFLSSMDLSFGVHGMIEHNKDPNKMVVKGFENGRPIYRPIGTPIPLYTINSASRRANFLFLQSLMLACAAIATGYEGLVGYYTSREWYILNYLRIELKKQPPLRVSIKINGNN